MRESDADLLAAFCLISGIDQEVDLQIGTHMIVLRLTFDAIVREVMTVPRYTELGSSAPHSSKADIKHSSPLPNRIPELLTGMYVSERRV